VGALERLAVAVGVLVLEWLMATVEERQWRRLVAKEQATTAKEKALEAM
jgi:uncharacterized protein YjeT (DUF2065 family)